MSKVERETHGDPDRTVQPEEPRTSVLAGPGSGLPCAYCQEVITREEIEYEIPVASFEQPDPPHDAPRLHVRCYELWRARRSA